VTIAVAIDMSEGWFIDENEVRRIIPGSWS
jgi:hypothetical protein